jgi:hypothetical protein
MGCYTLPSRLTPVEWVLGCGFAVWLGGSTRSGDGRLQVASYYLVRGGLQQQMHPQA